MSFNLAGYFRERGVPYTDSGPQTARGNIYIACPFCGADDSRRARMGINTTTGRWGCWKEATHRGNKPHRLLMAVLRLTWEEAEALVKSDAGVVVGLDELKRRVVEMNKKAPRPHGFEKLHLPSQVFAIKRGGLRGRFWDYLANRGFLEQDVDDLVDQYRLKGCLSGRWGGRVILPIFHGGLVGWTGRALGKSFARYLTEPPGDTVKGMVFNHDVALAGGRLLFICEGPLDALKIDFYGQEHGARAVAMLGVAQVERRIPVLMSLGRRYERVVVLVDSDAQGTGMRLASTLSMLNPVVGSLPPRVKDPGELTPAQVAQLVAKLG